MSWRKSWPKLNIYGEAGNGECSKRKMLPDERSVWDDYLDMAQISPIRGHVCIASGIGYSFEQLSMILKTPVETIKNAERKMIKFDMINVDSHRVVEICNWKKYQSEYERQKQYRVTTQGDNKRLQRERETERERETDINIEKKKDKNKDCGHQTPDVRQTVSAPESGKTSNTPKTNGNGQNLNPVHTGAKTPSSGKIGAVPVARPHWKQYIATFQSFFDKMAGQPVQLMAKNVWQLRNLYDFYTPACIMACWRLWITVDSGSWSPFAERTGHAIDPFTASLPAILDHPDRVALQNKFKQQLFEQPAIAVPAGIIKTKMGAI